MNKCNECKEVLYKTRCKKSENWKVENACCICKEKYCDKHSGLMYIDESNESITKNAPIVCIKCYKKRTG